jgi:hypothetical protein
MRHGLRRALRNVEPPAVTRVEARPEPIEERDREALVNRGCVLGLGSSQMCALVTEVWPRILRSEHGRCDRTGRDQDDKRKSCGR